MSGARLQLLEILRSIWRPLAALFLLDVVIAYLYVVRGWRWIAPDAMPLPLLGAGLGVFLGVRINTAYARWWEARTLWGAATNNSRSFARGVLMLLGAPEQAVLRGRLLRLQVAWAHALRCTLSREAPWPELARLLPGEDLPRLQDATSTPYAVQREIAALLAAEMTRGGLDGMRGAALHQTLSALADAQGGLERIRNTPMPRHYDWFPRAFVRVYCVMLPFGIVPSLGLLTPLGSTVIGFLFLALDQAGTDLEHPFAGTVHDVPMRTITRTIETDLQEAGAADTPGGRAAQRPASAAS